MYCAVRYQWEQLQKEGVAVDLGECETPCLTFTEGRFSACNNFREGSPL